MTETVEPRGETVEGNLRVDDIGDVGLEAGDECEGDVTVVAHRGEDPFCRGAEALPFDEDHLTIQAVERSQPEVPVRAELADGRAPVEHPLDQGVRSGDLKERVPLELESL